MTGVLFEDDGPFCNAIEPLAKEAWILRGFALPKDIALWEAIQIVLKQAPLRRMQTPGGRLMSAQQTNCGRWGWITDYAGYRYTDCDPVAGMAWPEMPRLFQDLAQSAAQAVGYNQFQPDACLINCYAPGTRMGLHQDKDEIDLGAPIVSVSLGLSTQFLWGGLKRTNPVQKVLVVHGDVVVWGGHDRLRFHGVSAPVKGAHRLCGDRRFNLTFRQAKC